MTGVTVEGGSRKLRATRGCLGHPALSGTLALLAVPQFEMTLRQDVRIIRLQALVDSVGRVVLRAF